MRMLQAGGMDKRIRKVALEGMLVSYESVVTRRIHRLAFESVVPSALRFYDLPEAVAAISPRDVWVVNPVNPMGHALRSSDVERQYLRAADAFKIAGVADRLRIRNRRPGEKVSDVYRDMIEDR